MSRLLQALFLAALLAPVAQAEAAAPPAILLAANYSPSLDVSLYLVSEKLDGVRAIWDGEILRFRSGRVIAAPAWFTAALPRVALDGELWIARGQFDRLSGNVRQAQPDDKAWRSVGYMLFELPGGQGSFVERNQQLGEIVRAANVACLVQVGQESPIDRQHLENRLAAVVAGRGEGLMLHRADAPYLTGRSDALLKLKPELDAEARGVGDIAGKGMLAGRVGALLVETEEGPCFKLGSGLSDAVRDLPPAIGSKITYRYFGLTPTGLPRLANFWRAYDE